MRDPTNGVFGRRRRARACYRCEPCLAYSNEAPIKRMGISSSTAVSIAALAGLDLQDPGDDAASGTAVAAAERFRSCFGATGCGASDCRVCLARFEPESVVSRLPCGHLFHSGCLETWLRYDRATCRARLLPLPLAVDEPYPPAPLPTVAY